MPFGTFWPPISEAGWTSRKKIPLGVRLKPARRSQIRRFAHVTRGENRNLLHRGVRHGALMPHGPSRSTSWLAWSKRPWAASRTTPTEKRPGAWNREKKPCRFLGFWRHHIHFFYHPNVAPSHNHTPNLRIRIPTTCQTCSRGGGSSSAVALSPRAPESGRRTAHGGHWHLWPPRRAQANVLSLETGASWCFTVLHRGRCRRRTKHHRNTGIANEVQHVQNIANPTSIDSPHQKEWSRITMRETDTMTYQTNNFQQKILAFVS